VVEGAAEGADIQDWQADLTSEPLRFWEEGWQALPAPSLPTTPKLIPVVTTGRGMEAMELAQIYFQRWNCQENSIRDWLIPLNLDTNHGYTKEQVVNSELAKRQVVSEGRVQRLERLAQASRARLSDLRDQDQHLQEQAQAYEQQWRELSLQVLPFEATNQTEERDYFPLKARQLAADWEVRQRKTKLEKHAARSFRILNKCEGYCRELRQVLRQQEDLEAQARDMYELDQTRVPDYDPLQGGTGQRRDVGTGSVFWRELSALWVATLVALLQARWLGYHDSQRGAARILCL
jgi:hypothetical protein